MQIKLDPTTYYMYAFTFSFEPSVVEFCRLVKEAYGWRNFNYVDNAWRFNDMRIALEIKNRYPRAEINSEIETDYVMAKIRLEKSAGKEKEAERIKNAKKSNIVVDGLKGKLYPYQKLGVEFLTNSDGRAILADTMGCISGDAMIIYNRGGNARQMSLRNLHQKLSGATSRGRKWDLKIPTLTRTLTPDSIFTLSPIKKIIPKGVKKVVELVATTVEKKEYTLCLTKDHRVATPTGWVEAGKIKKGDSIIVNGDIIKWCTTCQKNTPHAMSDYSRKYLKNYGKCKTCIYHYSRNNFAKNKTNNLADGEHFDKNGYVLVSGLYFHPRAKPSRARSTLKPVRKHVLVYEAFLNDVSYAEWIKMNRFNKFPAEGVQFVDGTKYCVHHKDGDLTNNIIGNLEMVNRSAHGKIHAPENIKNLWNIVPTQATVKSVTPKKEIDVYDIQMGGKYKNFIANGIVVHNCGKTVQSLAYALYTKKKKILVICPASVKHSWNDEVKKWTKLKSELVNSKSNKKIFTDPKIQVVIINYDIVIKFYDAIVAGNFDTLVVDEFTYIKNSSARRTKVVKQISKIIPSVILLSGTPILSRPVELFNGLNIIDRNTWSNYYDYTLHYCNGHQGRWGWDARGASNIDELQQKINKYFIRRTKEEVLLELPKKIFIKRPVELEPDIQQEYTMAINEFGEFLRKYRDKKTPEILRSLQAEKLVKLGELRQLTTRGKINAAEDIINGTIRDEEKILVFSCYNEPLEKLYDKFKKQAVIITGKTPEDDRKKAIELFQSDPKIKIFFGGIKSAGMGITLTAATNVLFVDYSWTPADHAQAIDRLHRPGQKALEVNIYYLYALDTIDEYMTKLLEKKQRIFDRLIEGESKEVHFPGGNMMKNVLQMIEREAKKADGGKLDLIRDE